MSITLIFLALFGVHSCYGSVLVPDYQTGSLYAGYNGEYAGKYDNYEKSYAYEYGVSDPHTGDHKSQWESKDKEGTVRGSYSLLEADGSTRIVDYIADEHGFRAVVKKVGVHGTTIETHGGAEEHHEPIAVAAPIQHVTHLEPEHTIVEQPIAYKSYDGGYDSYTDLKPVVADVYTKPEEYLHAPEAKVIIKVPEHHVGYPQYYPKAEGLKFALPQGYYTPEKYVVPQNQFVLSQEKYIVPQAKYVIPQEKYILPQEYHHNSEYVVPAEKQAHQYIAPEYHHAPEVYHAAPEHQEYHHIPEVYHAIPEHKEYQHSHPINYHQIALPEHNEYHHAPVAYDSYEHAHPEYKENIHIPYVYHQPKVSHEYLPAEKGAYSYVKEERYTSPKEVSYNAAPVNQYYATPSHEEYHY